MIQLLQKIWNSVTSFLFPQDIFAWQTMVYLGVFSIVMAWVARLSETSVITESLIATAGWIFFAMGVGWFLEDNKVRPFGISLAPWVAGAVVCVYFFTLVPINNPIPAALMTWPLVSVAIVAVPKFFNWELRPKLPKVPERQQLILLLLIAMLLSSWFQFYFRLQDWFAEYPTLRSDTFSNSGFVYRLSTSETEQPKGVSLLTATEVAVKDTLDNAPWPYVERWLLNLGDQVGRLRVKTQTALEDSSERDLWQLQAQTRSLREGYALDLLAIWSGPASDPEGYYFRKTCSIQPQVPPQAPRPENEQPAPPTPLAKVDCGLETPKTMGAPGSAA